MIMDKNIHSFTQYGVKHDGIQRDWQTGTSCSLCQKKRLNMIGGLE